MEKLINDYRKLSTYGKEVGLEFIKNLNLQEDIDPLAHSEHEKDLLSYYRQINDYEKNKVLDFAKEKYFTEFLINFLLKKKNTKSPFKVKIRKVR